MPAEVRLKALGWDEWFKERAREAGGKGLVPARVIETHQRIYRLAGAHGEFLAKPTGKMFRAADKKSELPAVGDWVLTRPVSGHDEAGIELILPRRTKLSREAAGEAREQVIGANLDTVFMVTSCFHEFNERRAERYIAAIRDGGADPVIVLNKCDLVAPDVLPGLVAAAQAVATGAPVLAVSAKAGIGFEALAAHLAPGRTVCLVGSSGVGKSTLLNRLMGSNVAKTQAVRDDDSRGRHTTSARSLRILPSGALLIDTPGMREFAPWGGEEVIEQAFPEMEALSPMCRFRNCAHDAEPGCAVREAVTLGRLEKPRYDAYIKLRREKAAARKKSPPKR